MRITAASASSRSTAALVTASSVASRERLCANEREISYSAPQLLRGLALGRERLLPFRGEPLRPLVELGVLRRDRQLAGECREQRQLVRLELAAEREVDRE